MKKILLIGRGQLGAYLKERLGVEDEFHWTGEMAELTADVLAGIAPDAVVNAASKTDLKWCEEHHEECFRCNVIAPLAVWRAACRSLPDTAPYIHLSTGCVWDGPFREDGKPFEPADPISPACFYSWCKASCDALLLRESDAHALTILRPRQIYSTLNSPRNTLVKFKAYPGLIDTPNSMTSVETIARTIEAILSEAGGRETRGRALSVYDRGAITPFQVGMIMAQMGVRDRPEKIGSAELGAHHKPKRVNTVMYDQLFERVVRPPAVEDEIKRSILAMEAKQWR